MKVEILNTLKGSSLWRKGLVFDDAMAPIPGDILREAKSGHQAVRVITDQAVAEKPIAAVETEIEIIESVEEETDAVWGVLPEASEDPLQERISETIPEKEESIKKETSKFQCKLCPWEGKTAPALKRHNTLVHK